MLVYTDAGLDVLLCKLCTMYFIVHDVTTNIPWCKSKLQKLLLVFLPCVGVSDMFNIESSVLKPVVFPNVNVKGLEWVYLCHCIKTPLKGERGRRRAKAGI